MLKFQIKSWEGTSKDLLAVTIIFYHHYHYPVIATDTITSPPSLYLVWSCPGLVHLLMWSTSQANVLEYSALAMACLFSRASASLSGIRVMFPLMLICRWRTMPSRSSSSKSSNSATIVSTSLSFVLNSHFSPSMSTNWSHARERQKTN